jgi:cellulose synthase/poly-beta-1,6-N-acetylglucosamine synthase-like glycosyltransferase
LIISFFFIIFITATVIQLCYWAFVFSKLTFYKPKKITYKKPDVPVSIIICARNEATNLKNNLHRILNQNYRSFEVIVVDDNSYDTTHNILLKYHIENPNLCSLKVVNKPDGSGKKFALSKGIEAAKNDILLLTDADCIPNSPDWISEMVRPLNDSVKIVLGYAPYLEAKGFLNKIIRYETILAAMQYFSFALMGQPYMGVGRNLLYSKSLYQKAGGFQKHDHLLSGDDDLFVNEIATSENVEIVLENSSFIYSAPKKSWKAFYRQKARHLTTGKHYKLKHKILLGLYSLSHFLHYAAGFVLIILDFSTIFVVGIIYLMRISVVLLLCRPILKIFTDETLLKWYPILDAFFVLYYLIFSPILMTGNTDQWK